MTTPTLHICTTCRAGQTLAETDARPGQIMHDAVTTLLDPAAPAVRVQEVVCLSSCDHGCAAAISMPGKWTYLLGLHAAAEDDLPARPSHHDAEDGEHEHDDFESFVVAIPETQSPDALLARLRQVAEAHQVLRIKGVAAVHGKPMRLAIQGVGGRFRQEFDRAWAPGEPRAGHLVVIGQTGMDRPAIEAGIAG